MAEETTEITTDFYSKAEAFFEYNKKAVYIGGAAIFALIAGSLFVTMKWLPDRNLAAQREMHMAEIYFGQDSFQLALNGNGVNKGFLQVIDNYSFTKSAKLANYYSGLCYLNLGDYQKAIDYLSKFSTSDQVIEGVKLNALGDAYMQIAKPDEGIKYYQKAADASDNEVYTPFYLKKAGMACEAFKKYDQAIAFYEKLESKYPNSEEGRDIERYLIRAKAASAE